MELGGADPDGFDPRGLLAALAEHAPLQSDPHELTAVVRVALGRAITQQWYPGNDEVQVIGLDTPLERLLLQVTRKNDAKGYERFKDLFEAIVAYNE